MPYRNRPASPTAKTVTLMVTEDCNLHCKYCYEENKTKKVMTLTAAQTAVDFLLAQPADRDTVVWEFIGGEPFLEIDLIDQITDYIIEKSKGHPCGNKTMFSFTTNGTLLGEPKVRAYLTKDKCRKSVSLSLDGDQRVHDINRCGSWESVMANFDWWRKNFPWCTTKSTVNRVSLPHIMDSIRFVAGLGLTDIFMNVVYEEEWDATDAHVYEAQLREVADYLLEDGRYQNVHVSFFNEALTAENLPPRSAWCGCGNAMIMVSPDGGLYPCLRFYSGRNQWPIGDIAKGIDQDRLRPFYFCHNERSPKCGACQVRAKCPHCIGWDYNSTGSIFIRSTNVCEMFKAQIRVNEYFFARIARLEEGAQ